MDSIRDLNGMLNSIRIQIQSFEAFLRVSPWDRELRRRIEQARIYELVILAKLSEHTMNASNTLV
jgi:hypothetical protein